MYARMVTSYVRPDRLEVLTAVHQQKLLPLVQGQPGYRGIFVLSDPDQHKEVSITFWERLVDMEVFNVHLLALKDEILPLLELAPVVEIYEVAIPLDGATMPRALGDMSLAERLKNPVSSRLAGEGK